MLPVAIVSTGAIHHRKPDMLRFLGFLIVLGLLVVVFGLIAGWFSVDTVEGGERTDVTVRIDRGAIERDVAEWKRRVEEAIGNGETIEGDLVAADAARREIEVVPAGKEKAAPAGRRRCRGHARRRCGDAC